MDGVANKPWSILSSPDVSTLGSITSLSQNVMGSGPLRDMVSKLEGILRPILTKPLKKNHEDINVYVLHVLDTGMSDYIFFYTVDYKSGGITWIVLASTVTTMFVFLILFMYLVNRVSYFLFVLNERWGPCHYPATTLASTHTPKMCRLAGLAMIIDP